jgi:hypothetical protein
MEITLQNAFRTFGAYESGQDFVRSTNGRASEKAGEIGAQRGGDNSDSDTVTISEEARALFLGGKSQETGPSEEPELPREKEDREGTASPERSSVNFDRLTPEEKQQVAKLKRIDRKVRAHEMAHKAVGGAYVRGGPNFEYAVGPDGRRYAVGGSVRIDVSPASSPQATVIKARIVRQAAMAPGDMSGSDRQVAAAASRMEAEAREELRQQGNG